MKNIVLILVAIFFIASCTKSKKSTCHRCQVQQWTAHGGSYIWQTIIDTTMCDVTTEAIDSYKLAHTISSSGGSGIGNTTTTCN